MEEYIEVNEYGYEYIARQVKKEIRFSDFLGLQDITAQDGYPVLENVETIGEFASLFRMDYDKIKPEDMDINTFLKEYLSYGEFEHTGYHPVKDFLSGLLDITIIIPIIDCILGEDIITGERLNDFQRGMKLAGAAVDLFTLGQAMALTGGLEAGAKVIAKTIAVELTGLKALPEERRNINSFADLMSPEDAERYLKFLENGSTAGLTKEELEGIKKVDELLALNKINYQDILEIRNSDNALTGGSRTVSKSDRIKIDGWDYTPTDDLYLKYKDIYDNPLYYDQITGKIHWPAEDGFKVGSKIEKEIPQNTIFKRYGENSGEFLGNATDSFELRALAPHSEGAEVHYYQLTEDCRMTMGEAAPWFGSEGGAEQFVKYKPDGSKYTIKELEDAGILEDITDLVEKGEIKID